MNFLIKIVSSGGKGLGVRTHSHLFRFPIFASNCGGDYVASNGIIPLNDSS